MHSVSQKVSAFPKPPLSNSDDSIIFRQRKAQRADAFNRGPTPVRVFSQCAAEDLRPSKTSSESTGYTDQKGSVKVKGIDLSLGSG